jgi:hypothetical protein
VPDGVVVPELSGVTTMVRVRCVFVKLAVMLSAAESVTVVDDEELLAMTDAPAADQLENW